MTNKIQRFIAFLLVLCIPIFAIAGCTNKDVANAANQATSSTHGGYSIDTKTTTPEGKLDVYMLDIGQGLSLIHIYYVPSLYNGQFLACLQR